MRELDYLAGQTVLNPGYTVPAGQDVNGWEGSAVFGGYSVNGGAQSVGVTSFDGNGNQVFDVRLLSGSFEMRQTALVRSGSDTLFGLVARGDAFGDTNGGGWDAWVGRLDATGAVAWSDHITGAGDQWVSAIMLDDGGDFFACGGSTDALSAAANQGGEDVWVRQWDNTGTVVWTQEVGSTGNDRCTALTADRDKLLLTGIWNGDATTRVGWVGTMDLDTGAGLAPIPFDTTAPSDILPISMLVSGLDVIVAGRTTGAFPDNANPSSVSQGFVARFDLEGVLQ